MLALCTEVDNTTGLKSNAIRSIVNASALSVAWIKIKWGASG